MMHSHAMAFVNSEIEEEVLILVVMDDALARGLLEEDDLHLAVLILVVMDDALALERFK